MEDKKNEIIAQGNQATPLITDMLVNEFDTLEIELPADCFKELLPTRGGSDYYRNISDLSEVKINNSFDINNIKNVKLRGSGDYNSPYIILPLRYNSMNAKIYGLEFTDMTLNSIGNGPSVNFYNKFRKINIYFNVNKLSFEAIQITVNNKIYQNET